MPKLHPLNTLNISPFPLFAYYAPFFLPQPLPYITVKKISKHRLFIEIIHVSLATILPWSYFQFPPPKKKFNFTMKMEFIIYVHITYILLTY